MNQSTAFYVKMAVVGVAVVGAFLLAATGKIDASTVLDKVTTLVGALVVALGISGGASALAQKNGDGK